MPPFIFAKLGVEQASECILKERLTLKTLFTAVEEYVREHKLTLHTPTHVMGTDLAPGTFNYVIYCADDHKIHAYAISDILFKLKEPTVMCLQQARDYVVTVRFRKLFKLRKMKTHGHDELTLPAPI